MIGTSVYTWGSNSNVTLGHDHSRNYPERLDSTGAYSISQVRLLTESKHSIKLQITMTSNVHCFVCFCLIVGCLVQVSQCISDRVWSCADLWPWPWGKAWPWLRAKCCGMRNIIFIDVWIAYISYSLCVHAHVEVCFIVSNISDVHVSKQEQSTHWSMCTCYYYFTLIVTKYACSFHRHPVQWRPSAYSTALA